MAAHRTPHPQSLVVAGDQPLIAIPLEEDGREVVCYFVEADPTPTSALPDTVQDALSLAGAWSDLDWEATVEALDRIRHESRPTPPIEL